MRSVFTRQLGRQDYLPVWRQMQQFTDHRDAGQPDELWFIEHTPVYTLGMRKYAIPATRIPVVQTDRGGLITYHGPGQIVVYTLLDLRRRQLGVKQLVNRLEQSIIDVLASYNIDGERKAGAPGVYVDKAKIAALGLRVRRGCTYHGLSLNVNMDLSPFTAIDPCGYPGLESCQMADFGVSDSLPKVAARLEESLLAQLDLQDGLRR